MSKLNYFEVRNFSCITKSEGNNLERWKKFMAFKNIPGNKCLNSTLFEMSVFALTVNLSFLH